MKNAVEILISRLSMGHGEKVEVSEGTGVVGTLARVYEKARSALEYRADHLVRRAAIERILKRYLVFERNPKTLAENLLLELRWAKYMSKTELNSVTVEQLTSVLGKYTDCLSREVPMEFAVGVASAQVEEIINLNVDWKEFTNFGFAVIKQKVKLVNVSNLDLLIFVAVDRIYSQSDDQQVSYHVVRLLNPNWKYEDLFEGWKISESLKGNKTLNKLMGFVRTQLAPLLLIRDIYYSDPIGFSDTMKDWELFNPKAAKVLEAQLQQTGTRVKTAVIRSVIYIFLTKMLFGFLVEVPLDIAINNHVARLPLTINLIFPPLLMWLFSLQIGLPNKEGQKKLIAGAWNDDGQDILLPESESKWSVLKIIFTGLYFALFIAIFWFIFWILGKIGFSIASKFIFIFFLSIVAFFAYRIRQTANVYTFKSRKAGRISLGDMLLLPILVMGSKFSQGLAKLNFLAFLFDFILEAPFKLILHFLDNWIQFLAIKKEEVEG